MSSRFYNYRYLMQEVARFLLSVAWMRSLMKRFSKRMMHGVLLARSLSSLLSQLTLLSIRDCPRCRVKRRATKRLSLARLPPVLMIHLKRFEANGRFSDKVDTFVDFPMKSLDLTNYMPPPLPPGVDKSQLNGGLPMSLEDPRNQLPPYRYDLYGVTNHYGNLSSGHCESSSFIFIFNSVDCFRCIRYRLRCFKRRLDVLR